MTCNLVTPLPPLPPLPPSIDDLVENEDYDQKRITKH